MTKFKFLLFVAALVGFASLSYAGFHEGKEAYVQARLCHGL